MKKPTYIPDRGDIVLLQVIPQPGDEQAGDRPALVLSPASYNGASGLMLCCPLTSHKKGYPFEVVISDDPHQMIVILADQLKSLNWKTRQAVKKGTASSNVVMETLSKLQALL